ncbi:MAG: AGE family epimerase/isomerase [Planctomycetota bacterium]
MTDRHALLERWNTVYRDGLFGDTLPFWIRHCVDREHGGFMVSLDQQGKVIDTDKGVWQQARFTWLLGELYNTVEPREEWLELALRGAQFLEQHCFDSNDGRMWFQVTREGRPLRKRRYAFTESFAAIAFGELAKATGDSHYADRALAAFREFIDHGVNRSSVQSKYTNTRPTRGLGFPMIAINTAQELRDSIGLPDTQTWIDHAIDQIVRCHLKPDIECVMETVGENGERIDHFDGRLLNPGHAIEAAWFLLDEANHRSDANLIRLGCDMLDWMWERGWDKMHGGLLYFVDVDGLPIQEYWHDMKFWWPQCEGLIATLTAFSMTGQSKYLAWHSELHDWAYSHFPDPEHGEWFGYLHRDGRISSTLKGNLWKGPFHLPRMQLKCWKLISERLTHFQD